MRGALDFVCASFCSILVYVIAVHRYTDYTGIPVYIIVLLIRQECATLVRNSTCGLKSLLSVVWNLAACRPEVKNWWQGKDAYYCRAGGGYKRGKAPVIAPLQGEAHAASENPGSPERREGV